MRCLLPLLALCTVFAADVAPKTGGTDPIPATGPGSKPLRIFLRSGPKSHGPGDHDHPAFLRDWVPLLKERGAQVNGGDTFPTAAQLAETDVLIIHRQVGGNFKPEERATIDAYAKRGGGFVVIHAGAVAGGGASDDYYRDLLGGSWRQKVTKWREGPMQLNFVDREHPITKGVADFGMKDEIYYDLDMLPGIHSRPRRRPRRKAMASRRRRRSGPTRRMARSARSSSSPATPTSISPARTSRPCCFAASPGPAGSRWRR